MLKNKFNFKLVIILIIISLISSFISFYPLVISNKKATLFSFEPDAPYVANAFRFIYSHKILYDGHPGTPSIISLAYAFTPIRIYTKFIDKSPFFLWSIRNIYSLFYYARLIQNLFFALSIFVFLLAVYNLTKNYLSIFYAWFGLFIFSYIPYLGIIIQSEPLSLLIISTWLYIFSKFVQKKNINLYLILCGLSGFAVANKLTNMFYVFASIFLIFSFSRLALKTKLNRSLKGILVSVFVFIFGTWPIRDRYNGLFGWIIELFSHSGIHGGGEKTLFSFGQYTSSLNALFSRETAPAILVAITLIFWVIYLKKNQNAKNIIVSIMLLFTTIGMLVFGKFPLVHYQIPLYVGILFISSYLSSFIYKPLLILIVGILAILSFNTIQAYWKFCFNEIKGTMTIENFIEKNPPKTATVWEWGKTADYTLIHIRDWSGNPFSQFLQQERPNLYSLTTDLSQIVLYYGKNDEVFNVCWDQLYIQGTELERFLEKYKDRKFDVKQIIGSTRDMYLVSSKHCTK